MRSPDAAYEAEWEAEEQRQRLFDALSDFGTSDRIAALDTLKGLVEKGGRDAMLLDGRNFNPRAYDEALRLLALLRSREVEIVGE